MIGKKVLVNAASNGSGELVRHRNQIQTITHVYVEGHVKTNTGDVWKVKPFSGKGFDFIIQE